MTVRKAKTDTTEEVVAELAWGKGTKAYRLILLGVALAATPIGQNILKGVGISSPAAQETAALAKDIASIKEAQSTAASLQADLLKDVAGLKANNAIMNEKFDNMKTDFQGFKVDFNKWKPEKEKQ